MCIFSDKELEFLNKNGNQVSIYQNVLKLFLQKVYEDLMSDYNPKIYPEPDKKDQFKMKEFFRLKYV